MCLADMHRLVTTTGERFGWVPCAWGFPLGEGVEAQRNDAFAVFTWCSTPILLCPIDDACVFRVVGEAYAHGMMDGEKMMLLEQRECELQEICLS